MVRRFTILDHVTAAPTTSAFGLTELLQEIQHPPPMASSRPRIPSLLVHRAQRPPRTTVTKTTWTKKRSTIVYSSILTCSRFRDRPQIPIDDDPQSPIYHSDHDDDDMIVSNSASHRPFVLEHRDCIGMKR